MAVPTEEVRSMAVTLRRPENPAITRPLIILCARRAEQHTANFERLAACSPDWAPIAMKATSWSKESPR